jgi:hypothetical protein
MNLCRIATSHYLNPGLLLLTGVEYCSEMNLASTDDASA